MKAKNLLLICLSFMACGCGEKPVSAENSATTPQPKKENTTGRRASFARMKAKARTACEFCAQKKYDQNFCILIDLSVHSGLNRFFVWDFKKDTFSRAFPVSHGCCDNNWSEDQSKENAAVSNKDGSHCSSLGRYKIGERGYSDWGIHVKYLMHGLDVTNSNAQARQIVLHSWERIPDDELYPQGTPEGWGCPALSNQNMRMVDSLLKRAQKPVLMWVYNEL